MSLKSDQLELGFSLFLKLWRDVRVNNAVIRLYLAYRTKLANVNFSHSTIAVGEL